MKRRTFIQNASVLSTGVYSNLHFSEFKPHEIAEITKNANLSTKFDPWTGDCLNIAIALSDIFTVDEIYELGVRRERGVGHVFVMKDEVYIDGKGVFNMPEIWNRWPEIQRQPETRTQRELKKESIYSEQKTNRIKKLIRKELPIIKI